MYYVEILRMEPPFSLLTDDGYASGGDPGAHFLPSIPSLIPNIPSQSIARRMSVECAPRRVPFLATTYVTVQSVLNDSLQSSLIVRSISSSSFTDTRSMHHSSFGRSFKKILNVDSPKDMTSIVVITDNIERHSLDFNIQFDESIGTTKEHYCPRCRQIRSPMLYVVNLRDPTKGTSFSDERCEACKNLRWKDLPAGGFKLEDSDELLTRDIPVYCTACDVYMADYFSGVDRFLNENAIERYSGDDGHLRTIRLLL